MYMKNDKEKKLHTNDKFTFLKIFYFIKFSYSNLNGVLSTKATNFLNIKNLSLSQSENITTARKNIQRIIAQHEHGC